MADQDPPTHGAARWLPGHYRSMVALAGAAVVAVILAMLPASGVEISLVDGIVLVLWAYLLVYLLVTMVVFTLAQDSDIRRWASRTERGTFVQRYLLGTAPGPGMALMFAVIAQIAATGWVSGHVGDSFSDGVRIAVAVTLVVLAWTSIVVSFAVTFYADDVIDEEGLDFPGKKSGRWTDYIYFAVGVMGTFGTTDVSVTSSAMRRTVTANSIIAFVFNTVTVAIVVSAIQGA